MKIHWLVWLLTGAVIAIVSYYLGGRLRLFFYLGLLFAAYGFIAMLVGFILRDKKPEPEKVTIASRMPRYGRCSTCKTVVKFSDNYCFACGSRLR